MATEVSSVLSKRIIQRVLSWLRRSAKHSLVSNHSYADIQLTRSYANIFLHSVKGEQLQIPYAAQRHIHMKETTILTPLQQDLPRKTLRAS